MKVPPEVLEELDRLHALIADLQKTVSNHGFEVSSFVTKPDVVYKQHVMNIVVCSKKQ